MKKWMFDEKKYTGVDYSDLEIARNYDARHQKFRNFREEADRIIGILNLSKDDRVIDMGCGTGAFSINAAPHCKKIIAVDISEGMLSLLNEKARKNHISNIETVCAGFLSYTHSGDPVDAVVSSVALHHLPNFWKIIALKKIHAMLKKEGSFYLFDVVFSFPPDEYEKYFDAWIEQMNATASEKMMEESYVHIRDEFSTTDKHMDLILTEAGFTIDKKDVSSPYTISYLCKKA